MRGRGGGRQKKKFMYRCASTTTTSMALAEFGRPPTATTSRQCHSRGSLRYPLGQEIKPCHPAHLEPPGGPSSPIPLRFWCSSNGQIGEFAPRRHRRPCRRPERSQWLPSGWDGAPRWYICQDSPQPWMWAASWSVVTSLQPNSSEFAKFDVPVARRRPPCASDTSPRAPEAFNSWPRPRAVWNTALFNTATHYRHGKLPEVLAPPIRGG